MRFCSQACRRKGGPDARDAALEAAIRTLLESRDAGASICTGEAARMVHAGSSRIGPAASHTQPRSTDVEGTWRALMPAARFAAFRLAEQGIIEIMQNGRVVADPGTPRGPIRIRLRRR